MTSFDDIRFDDELDQLLAQWAARYRLTSEQVAAVRTQVLHHADSETALDADWLWSLLRPVTDLLDRVGELSQAQPADSTYATLYLKLA